MVMYAMYAAYDRLLGQERYRRDKIEFYWLIDMGLVQTAQMKFPKIHTKTYSDETIEANGWVAVL